MKKRLLLLLAAVLVAFTFSNASVVRNQPYQVQQPDGTTIHCFVSGDEYFNWLHDANGFTIIQAADGYYYYGIRQDEVVVPSEFRVNQVDPEVVGLRKWAKVSRGEYERLRSQYLSDNSTSVMAPHTGTMNNLVIYIKFADDAEFSTTRQTYDDLFNLTTGVSLKSYYTEVSYNQLTISSTHYPACAMTTNLSYTDSHNRNYFEPYNATTNPNGYSTDNERRLREHGLLRDAINWINANSPVPSGLNIDADNDGYVDNVCFIVRGDHGAWASLLWAHRWVLYSYNVSINGKQVWDYTFQPETQVDVTTLCHETFHTLGAPDLYHYDDGGLNISPAASWDLMEYGGGHMTAYMKWKYAEQSWITSIPEITTSGTYTLQPLTSSTNNCYKIASPNSYSEYYVVEYRKATGTYEGSLPGSGLIVYRIDPSLTGNADGPPDELYIYRPNGTTTTNGTPSSAYFSAGSGRTAINDGTNPAPFLQDGSAGGLNIYNITAAGSTISFTVGMSTVQNPSMFSATPVSTTQIDLSWTKNSSNNNVMLVYNTTPTFGIPQNGTSYSAGNTISGGGIVIYAGSGTSFNHTALNPATTYYYKLWSVDGTFTYSNGITTNATTLCGGSSLPYSESFTGELFPACWSTQYSGTGTVNSWSASATNNAGGTACEMKSTFQDINPGTTRLITPSFNTTGITQLNLSFRYLLDDWAPGATLKVQSSSNGTTWTDEAWSLATTSNTMVGPYQVNTIVTSNLNSSTTYIAFVVTGDLYQYDYWYIDDVNIQNGGSQSYTITTVSNPVSGGTTSGGGNYLIGQTVTVVATPSTNWNFLNWTENGTPVSSEPSYSFTASANRDLVANFSMNQVTVSTTANPSSGGTTTGDGTYTIGDQVTAIATPNTGYGFVNWTVNGNVVSTDATYSFIANNSVNLTANFAVLQYTINVSASPVDGGSVSGGGTYSYNANVTVVASANTGWDFTGWYEDGSMVSGNAAYSFNALENRDLEAQFMQQVQVYNILVIANPADGGIVTGGGSATAGSQVTVTATSNEGWAFSDWSVNGQVVSYNQSYTFTVSDNITLTANFIQVFAVTALVSPDNAGYINGEGSYTYGSMATLTAHENAGYRFANWTLNGNIVSLNAVYSFEVYESLQYVANFLSTVSVPDNNKPSLRVYPNPVSSILNIESSTIGFTKITLLDQVGKVMISLTPETVEKRIMLDLSGYTPGMYALQIKRFDGTSTTIKVIVK